MALTRIQYLGPSSSTPYIIGEPAAVKSGSSVTVSPNGQMRLTPTGVAAGSYFNADITVGADGRIIRCNDGSPQINPLTDFEPGTIMLFGNTSAPPNWVQLTGSQFDNVALRVVKADGGGSGGTTSFTSMASSYTPQATLSQSLSVGKLSASGKVGAVFLSQPQLPAHTHTYGFTRVNQYATVGNAAAMENLNKPWDVQDLTAPQENSQGTHLHYFTGTTSSAPISGTISFSGSPSAQFEVKYFDMIVAQSS